MKSFNNLFFIVTTIVILVVFIILFFYFGKIKKVNGVPLSILNIHGNGSDIPIIASFTGFKFSPSKIISIAHNNLNPKLVLYDDYFIHKVVFSKESKYDDIESVDIFEMFLTENIIITFRNSQLTFTANLSNKDSLARLVDFLNKKGVFLSDKAKELLKIIS